MSPKADKSASSRPDRNAVYAIAVVFVIASAIGIGVSAVTGFALLPVLFLVAIMGGLVAVWTWTGLQNYSRGMEVVGVVEALAGSRNSSYRIVTSSGVCDLYVDDRVVLRNADKDAILDEILQSVFLGDIKLGDDQKEMLRGGVREIADRSASANSTNGTVRMSRWTLLEEASVMGYGGRAA